MNIITICLATKKSLIPQTYKVMNIKGCRGSVSEDIIEPSVTENNIMKI